MRDRSKINLKIAAGVQKLIEKHPESFDCLLYRPDFTSEETTGTGSDVVGSFEETNRNLTYLDAVETKALKLVTGFPLMATMNLAPGDTGENIITMLLLADAPNQSVIQYREYVSDTETRTVNMYVLEAELIGEAPTILKKYHCVPFYNDEAIL
jgi:hypothetical protein